jgi:hypothetical protein
MKKMYFVQVRLGCSFLTFEAFLSQCVEFIEHFMAFESWHALCVE